MGNCGFPYSVVYSGEVAPHSGASEYATEKNVLLSINPDAHSLEGFNDTKYGVLAGQKGGLTKEQNLSSFSLQQFEEYLSSRRKEKGI